MERLDLLEKIYLYGETLSSEEMNLIVSYINLIIEALNSVIRNNNGISNGHCEMRYILSPTLPLKPETGTNGLSNGWSNLYLLPEVGSGTSTWMSLCFVTGENTYGEWSSPICIYSGTMSGQLGPKGDSGLRGAFISRVFKRSNTKPDTPVGGTYDYPIPEGWSDGIPEGLAIIWSSTCTFYGNGTKTEWSEPAQESDTATLDIEFSPNPDEPLPPIGDIPFFNHESEGWYDPNSPNFSNVGVMIWRAERKVSNGEYDGDWTITRIFGEKGDRGLKGETGGHYEFRYMNFKATPEYSAPIKPAEGTEGTSGGWQRDQLPLTELEIKEGTFTWMTLCYQNEYGIYGVWTDPIRITGANGIDGEDGTELEFIYTRNNTGIAPAAPPTTQKNDWYGTDPVTGVVWTDDPMGVDDDLMWEYVSTRVKEGNIWSAYSTPVVWAKWGKQGKIGQMTYLAGVWNSNTTYTKDEEKNPVVYYNNEYYYLRAEVNSKHPSTSSTGQNPESRPDIWAKAENFEMVFTDILFVNEFAKLGSFIVNHDWMISKNGTLYDESGNAHDIDDSHSWNGWDANSAYIKFNPQYPDKNASGSLNFVPAIAIDSLSGRAFFWKGKFTGDVHANNGYFRGEVHATSGDFTGEVHATSGNFTGTINATNSYFSGEVHASSGDFTGTVNATDGHFTGEITATSGSITGEISIGNGTNKMYIRPNSSNGAELVGINNNDEKVLCLGFSASGYGHLDLGRSYFDNNKLKIDSNNDRIIALFSDGLNFTGEPDFYISRDYGLASFHIILKNNNKMRLGGYYYNRNANTYSLIWPTSASEVDYGEVYSDNGVLKVKTTRT